MIKGAMITGLFICLSAAAHAGCGPSVTISGGVTNTNSFGFDNGFSSNGNPTNSTDRSHRDYDSFKISLKIPLGKDYCSEKKEQDFYLQQAKVKQQNQKNAQDKIKFCAANKTLPEAALYCQEFIVDTSK